MIVFGGPPSVGSSLLVRILDRHPEIAAGPETALFARTSLMTDWNRDKDLLITKHWRKLRDHGWHRYRGTTLIDDFYPWDKISLSQMIHQAETFQAFVDSLEPRLHAYQQTKLWIEKTPSNAYNFGWLQSNLPDIKFIMMIRNPYDAISSMIHRGFSVFYATAAYLLHASAGYMGAGDHIHYLKYEDLIVAPEKTITQLCNFVGVSYEAKMLTPDQDDITMPGWLQSESGPIGDKSINRFQGLSKAQQAEVINCVSRIRTNSSFQLAGLDWGFDSIKKICEHWGYAYQPSMGNYKNKRHQIELFQEAWIRTMTLYPTHLFNFPLSYQI